MKDKEDVRYRYISYMYHMCIHIYNLYMKLLSHKKNEILSLATVWMDIEGVMLSEKSQRKTLLRYHFNVGYKK